MSDRKHQASIQWSEMHPAQAVVQAWRQTGIVDAGYELKPRRRSRGEKDTTVFSQTRIRPGIRLETVQIVGSRFAELHQKLVTMSCLTDEQWDEMDSDAPTRVTVARAAEFMNELSTAAFSGQFDVNCASRIELLSMRDGGMNIIIPLAWKELDLSIAENGSADLLIVDLESNDHERRYEEVVDIQPSDLIRFIREHV